MPNDPNAPETAEQQVVAENEELKTAYAQLNRKEREMLVLRVALLKIQDGDGAGCRRCECDDHTSPDCCNNPDIGYFCPTCIAASALAAQERISRE